MPAYQWQGEFLIALQEIAWVENHLRDGKAKRGEALHGSHAGSAIFHAATDFGESFAAVASRAGQPTRPGSSYNHFRRADHPEAEKLIVDWDCYRFLERPYDEVLAETVEIYKAHGNSARAASIAAGVARGTFQDRLHRAATKGLLGFKPVTPGFEVNKTTTVLDAGGEVQREYISQRKERGEKFEVPDGHLAKGLSTLVDAEGRIVQQWVKTREDQEHAAAAMKAAIEALKEELPRVPPTKGPEKTRELLLNQYTITDSHFGSLSWAEETRSADYDLKIAEKLLLDWFAAAIGMAPDAEVAVLAQLGDLMHHDAHESVTPSHKNVLDADSRLQKVIRVVIRVLRQVIAMLLERHKRVHVIMASGNHDPASSAWLRELLHAMYEDEPRLTVDNSPDIYYAFEWGKTALFYHHGHKRKIESVDSVFAGKFREIYGKAEHSYGHIGHFHSDQVKDSNLMRIERHRTLAPPDAYASGGGWLSRRDAKVISYHKTWGEVSRITLSPQMVQS